VDLSTPAEARPARTWISLLSLQVRASLAASTGVEDPDDVIKYLLAGADVVMSASALLRHGPEHASVLLEGLDNWMLRKGYKTVGAFRGILATPPDTDQAAYERADYVQAMRSANAGHGVWNRR
jgi:dihydroorotate dehydrogenase (fumarate)